jgi:hypothetical protein
MNKGEGFLAIFNDVPAAEETDYLHWLTREHAQERLSVPGFLRVRVFRASERGTSRYFILYRLRDAGVIASGPYLARLNAPTAWSKRIMPMLKDFMRGGGSVVAETGQGEGGVVLPIVCAPADAQTVLGRIDKVATMDEVASVRFFEVNDLATAIPTAEKATRAGDGSFAALLMVEGLTDRAVERARDVFRPLMNVDRLAKYRHIFSRESQT